MRYDGTRDELERIVAETNLIGVWSEEGDRLCFRSRGGAFLTWWPHSRDMRILVQGSSADCEVLERQLKSPIARPPPTSAKAKIFVVHGHDTAAREQLELVLHRLDLAPFILQNTSGAGMTVIEALEKDVVQEVPAFGIVLMTPDDVGYAVSAGSSSARPRARQNVILELGMLIARIGRSRVAILLKGSTEVPSDASGVIYLRFKTHMREVVPNLVARLNEAGFSLDPSAIARASA